MLLTVEREYDNSSATRAMELPRERAITTRTSSGVNPLPTKNPSRRPMLTLGKSRPSSSIPAQANKQHATPASMQRNAHSTAITSGLTVLSNSYSFVAPHIFVAYTATQQPIAAAIQPQRPLFPSGSVHLGPSPRCKIRTATNMASPTSRPKHNPLAHMNRQAHPIPMPHIDHCAPLRLSTCNIAKLSRTSITRPVDCRESNAVARHVSSQTKATPKHASVVTAQAFPARTFPTCIGAQSTPLARTAPAITASIDTTQASHRDPSENKASRTRVDTHPTATRTPLVVAGRMQKSPLIYRTLVQTNPATEQRSPMRCGKDRVVWSTAIPD